MLFHKQEGKVMAAASSPQHSSVSDPLPTLADAKEWCRKEACTAWAQCGHCCSPGGLASSAELPERMLQCWLMPLCVCPALLS